MAIFSHQLSAGCGDCYAAKPSARTPNNGGGGLRSIFIVNKEILRSINLHKKTT